MPMRRLSGRPAGRDSSARVAAVVDRAVAEHTAPAGCGPKPVATSCAAKTRGPPRARLEAARREAGFSQPDELRRFAIGRSVRRVDVLAERLAALDLRVVEADADGADRGARRQVGRGTRRLARVRDPDPREAAGVRRTSRVNEPFGARSGDDGGVTVWSPRRGDARVSLGGPHRAARCRGRQRGGVHRRGRGRRSAAPRSSTATLAAGRRGAAPRPGPPRLADVAAEESQRPRVDRILGGRDRPRTTAKLFSQLSRRASRSTACSRVAKPRTSRSSPPRYQLERVAAPRPRAPGSSIGNLGSEGPLRSRALSGRRELPGLGSRLALGPVVDVGARCPRAETLLIDEGFGTARSPRRSTGALSVLDAPAGPPGRQVRP